MHMKSILTGALGLTLLGALPAMASDSPKIYAYPSSANYCPAGLQPITISGVICCGVPNQSMSYSEVMTHPVTRRKARKASYDCPIGTKGCTYD
ncbi:hypothetical protein DSM107133_01145 [Pseudosulfitobacter sp. DSM 107133]|nr:hypothetical protein DSM107133_01145 [Pseudosulfitobacter sp. DSM 107133]